MIDDLDSAVPRDMIFFLVRTCPGRVSVLSPLSSVLLCSTLPKS